MITNDTNNTNDFWIKIFNCSHKIQKPQFSKIFAGASPQIPNSKLTKPKYPKH